MQMRTITKTLLAAAVLATGCNQPTRTAEKPAVVNDPFDNVLAQKAPPAKTLEVAPAPAESVKTANGMMLGKIYLPTGEAATSAMLLEKSMPSEVQANKPFTYEIKITNIAKTKLESIKVQELVPGTLRIADATEGSVDGQPHMVTYNVDPLSPGQSTILRLTGTATQSGALPTCLSASYNTALCMAASVVSPALKVNLAGTSDALQCDQLSYKAVVTNSGSGQARNVRIESVLPDGLTTPDGKAVANFDAGTLEAGQSREFTFNARAAKTGAFAVKAIAKANEDLVSESAVVNTAVKRPVLLLTKAAPEKAFIGQPIAYELSVSNKGDGPARNVMLTDSLPKGATIQSISDNGRADAAGRVGWNLGEIAAGATKKVAVVATFSEAGEMKSGAAVSGDCADRQVALSTTKLEGVPAILLEVTDTPDPVRVGTETTYTIEITNQGTAPGTMIKLVATLEEPMTLLSATGETKESVQGQVLTFAPIGSLPPKAKATYKIKVKAAKSADVRFKASMTSDQLGRPVEETEATNFF
jgi:uncharacterized repeat protein (TIGR01451 family)